jgi:predicted ATP-binding protein involved in virulence
MDFPYISQIKVHNCFTYRNFSIPNAELGEFRHIVLTGMNGSGKTTILNRIAFLISHLQDGKMRSELIAQLTGIIAANQKHLTRPSWEQQIREAEDIDLAFLGGNSIFFKEHSGEYIFSFFKAHRKVELKQVNTITKEDEFLSSLKTADKTDDFISQFKQYLVNKKVYEAFDFMNSREEKIKQSKLFFDNLTQTLGSILKDEKLELEFVQERFEFYLKFTDERRVTFNQLSEGFSAFLSIIMDLLMRTDLIRKTKNDYSFEPGGIVLIDEPETHFHLSMQYEILPLINKLFPNIQLIIATHSPAIVSSIKNAIVYDLTSKDEVADWVLGSSYSELMIKHFGLDNEYSPVADKIILEINKAVNEKDIERLQLILVENESYLTPSLILEIESQIIHLQSSR